MSAAVPVPFDVRLMNMAATVLFAACAVVLAAAGAWWAVRHPAFAVTAITVQGDLSHNSVPTLRANVAPRLVGNFYTLDLAAAREVFESVPWVRSAIVKRQFPNRLKVQLQEHRAVALWGGENDSKLVNDLGEVFEANVGDVEQDDLPRLAGSEGQSGQVLAMYRELAPLFETLALGVRSLELDPRGSWQMELDNGAQVELGRGTSAQVVARARVFVHTLTQVASRHGRRPDALVSADLRYPAGYAVRLRGVGTVAADAGKK